MFEEDSVTSSSPPKPSPSPPSSNSSSSSSSSSSSATASSSSRAPFQFMWEKVKVTGTTTPRGYHAAAVNNNKMYIYGGVAQRQNITDFCYLDLVTWEWHQIMSGGVNPPSARMGLSCTSYKDLLIFVGGTHGRSCQVLYYFCGLNFFSFILTNPHFFRRVVEKTSMILTSFQQQLQSGSIMRLEFIITLPLGEGMAQSLLALISFALVAPLLRVIPSLF